MEEFQEANVLWPDAHHHDCRHHAEQQPHAAARPVHLQSAPVRIPSVPAEARPTSRHSWARSYDGYGDDDSGMIVRTASRASGAEAAIVPPHVLTARRCAEERRVASSVCVGQGRTLKGRDLRAVRNAVLHMTGFLRSSDEY